ncbi:MAG: hypothetical protein ACOVRN_10440 [Flavobacterium sp.]
MKRNKRSKRRLSRRIQRGGLLIMNLDTDLINTHICNLKPGVEKDTPGLEVLTSISNAFQLNSVNLGYFQELYKSSRRKWFKFIVINNDGNNYIYVIDGAHINKHSVCMLQGLLEVTEGAGEYADLRNAYNRLMIFKNQYGSNMASMNTDTKNRCLQLISEIDELINRDIPCMPVLAAGSGSVNNDNSICINNKSGHYKPTESSMLKAKESFETNTGVKIFVKEKEDKALLQTTYGNDAQNYSGICL